MTETITVSPQRSIGGIAVQCTVREQHQDRVTKTRHPVEAGPSITDHVYNEPAVVIIEAGWSNSSPDAGGDEGFVIDTYDSLLALKGQLLTVVTGKRTYQNPPMVMVDLRVITDEESETALAVTATFEEMNLVTTQVATVPDSSVQANPQKTGAVQNNGTIQAVPSAVVPAAAPTGS